MEVSPKLNSALYCIWKLFPLTKTLLSWDNTMSQACQGCVETVKGIGKV